MATTNTIKLPINKKPENTGHTLIIGHSGNGKTKLLSEMMSGHQPTEKGKKKT